MDKLKVQYRITEISNVPSKSILIESKNLYPPMVKTNTCPNIKHISKPTMREFPVDYGVFSI